MTVLLAIDPGARTGFARFEGGVLLGAGAASPDSMYLPTFHDPAHVVVIENPRIYPQSKARPADILKLARIVGRYEERFKRAEIRLVEPRQWKGTIDGDLMVERIRDAFSAEERRAVQDLYDHNAIDAIGLGKWSLRQPWMRGR